MPQADHECGTCHNACACREARFKRMEELLKEVLLWGTFDMCESLSVDLWLKVRAQIEKELSE